jgi:Fe2+ transport system protein FeoA
MRPLTECDPGCTGTIVKIHAKDALKQRLISLGIMKNAAVTVMAKTAGKSTIEIKIGKIQLALRKEEAELIEVE